jgi:hypothetical protein
MEKMSYSKKILIAIVAVLIVIAGFCIYRETNLDNKPLSVVYLSSGEIYIGKIIKFPKLQLRDAYLLQVVKKIDETAEPQVNPETGEIIQPQAKTSFQLTPLKDALWAPEKLYLNREQVLFYGPIKESSKVAETINSADSE